MRVLLLADVRKVGRKNEVKEVADGYARNFLIARKLAVPADEGALKVKAKTEAEVRASADLNKGQAAKLKKDILKFSVRAGTKGEVFGSVTLQMIGEAMKKNGYRDFSVVLERPIKSLGAHKVKINFEHGIESEALIEVVPE